MDINLRRAATLQDQIKQFISDISLDPSQDDFEISLTQVESAERILYSLRDRVGKANVDSTVSTLLTRRVQLNNIISRYERLVRQGKTEFKDNLSNFRKERVNISEQILELNISTNITLPEEDEEILISYHIL